jgi:cell division protein ZapA (FtsZ GTPase activity inhibitor)
MPTPEQLKLTIGGQDVVMQVTPEEREDVLAAAKLVEQRMTEFSQRGALNAQKQAVLTAFGLAFDWLRVAKDPAQKPETRQDLERRIDTMINRCETIAKAGA